MATSKSQIDSYNFALTRAGGFFKDRLRSYRVQVDNHDCGTVKEYDTLRLQLEPGSHKVQVRIDFLRSRKLTISILDNDVVHLVCAAGKVSGFENIPGYVKLWEGELSSVSPPEF